MKVDSITVMVHAMSSNNSSNRLCVHSTTYSISPSTDPCGTPHVKTEPPDSALPTTTFSYLSLMYDLNHASALSVMLNDCSSRVINNSWATESNAADKRSITRIVVHFLSSVAAMSFLTRSNAVSVEWPRRYADWKGSCKRVHQCAYWVVLRRFFQPMLIQMASSTVVVVVQILHFTGIYRLS